MNGHIPTMTGPELIAHYENIINIMGGHLGEYVMILRRCLDSKELSPELREAIAVALDRPFTQPAKP